MKYLTTLLACILLTGCATAKTAVGISPSSKSSSSLAEDFIYYPVISLKERTYSTTSDSQYIDFDGWLADVIRAEKTALNSCVANVTDDNVKTIDQLDRDSLFICFENLSNLKKIKYRNQIVSNGMSYSDNNCIQRGNKTSNIINTTDSFMNILTSSAAIVGVAVSDAPSARAAAGVYGAVSTIWKSSKNNLLKDADFGELTARLATLRVVEAEAIQEKTHTNSNQNKDYYTWPLMMAVQEVNQYDNQCDFFK